MQKEDGAKLILSADAMVYNRDEIDVEIKFLTSGVKVVFPRELFAAVDDLTYGSKVTYEVYQTTSGNRIKRFLPFARAQKNRLTAKERQCIADVWKKAKPLPLKDEGEDPDPVF